MQPIPNASTIGAERPPSWQVADHLFDNSTSAHDSLYALSLKIMTLFQKRSETTFDDSLVTKVWNSVSSDRIKHLNQTLAKAIKDTFLPGFSDEQIRLLVEIQKNPRMDMTKSHLSVAELYSSKKALIEADIAKEAESMEESFTQDILQALNKEGVQWKEDRIALPAEKAEEKKPEGKRSTIPNTIDLSPQYLPKNYFSNDRIRDMLLKLNERY